MHSSNCHSILAHRDGLSGRGDAHEETTQTLDYATFSNWTTAALAGAVSRNRSLIAAG
jgi:hypothetical protein